MPQAAPALLYYSSDPCRQLARTEFVVVAVPTVLVAVPLLVLTTQDLPREAMEEAATEECAGGKRVASTVSCSEPGGSWHRHAAPTNILITLQVLWGLLVLLVLVLEHLVRLVALVVVLMLIALVMVLLLFLRKLCCTGINSAIIALVPPIP
jgi:hypothetical protein